MDWKQWVRTIVSIRATPRQVSLGVALGAFLAFTPLIGLQMLLAALLATAIGASRKAAMLAVWISNPLTMGPIFAVTYQLGVVLGSPTPAMAAAPGEKLGVSAGSMAGVGGDAYGLDGMLQAGWGYVLPMCLGGAVLGLVAALVSYQLTHRGVLAYQAVHSRRRRVRSGGASG